MAIRYTDPRILIPRESSEPRHESIIEGRCPTCGGELEREPDHGWCHACKVGWAYQSTGDGTAEVALVLKADVSAFTAAMERAGEAIERKSRRA